MATIRNTAKDHVLTTTKNISELDRVQADLEIHTRKGNNEAGISFEYNYITVDEQDYRMPNSVLGQLKVLIEDDPSLNYFKVKKTGEGMQTRYTVIPDNKEPTLSKPAQCLKLDTQLAEGMITQKGYDLAMEQLK